MLVCRIIVSHSDTEIIRCGLEASAIDGGFSICEKHLKELDAQMLRMHQEYSQRLVEQAKKITQVSESNESNRDSESSAALRVYQ